jgi:hypothetical protein
MENGEHGVLGCLVVPLVEVEPRQEKETVTLLLHQMEAMIVLVLELKTRLAIWFHVQSVSIYKLNEKVTSIMVSNYFQCLI